MPQYVSRLNDILATCGRTRLLNSATSSHAGWLWPMIGLVYHELSLGLIATAQRLILMPSNHSPRQFAPNIIPPSSRPGHIRRVDARMQPETPSWKPDQSRNIDQSQVVIDFRISPFITGRARSEAAAEFSNGLLVILDKRPSPAITRAFRWVVEVVPKTDLS